jgi:iron complex transport system substrate-binding protein
MERGPRIVSLIPSATEIVAELGYGHLLVGRSHACDSPPEVRELPACTGPNIDTSEDSAGIHRQVRAISSVAAEQAASVYEVDRSLLEALQPEVVITQSQCEVCAVSEREVRQVVAGLAGSDPTVVTCEPRRLADVWGDIERIAAAIGDAGAGRSLAERLQGELGRIEARADEAVRRPGVGSLEWLDPVMGPGHWLPELMEIAGGRSVFGEAGAAAQWLDFEALRGDEVERLVAVPCGFDLDRAEGELERLLCEDRWQELPMVRAGELYAADGQAYFNRPGPGVVASARILGEIVHPELFAPAYRDSGWRRQWSGATAGAE